MSERIRLQGNGGEKHAAVRAMYSQKGPFILGDPTVFGYPEDYGKSIYEEFWVSDIESQPEALAMVALCDPPEGYQIDSVSFIP